MAGRSSTRAALLARMSAAMGEFMATAVFFQDAVARSVGLNGTDLQLVGELLRAGPATPGELARRTGLSAGGAITTALDRLERGGWVRRERDPDDRRRVLVVPVESTVWERVGPVYERVGAQWSAYVRSLPAERAEFAVELITEAARLNRAAIEELRDPPR